ncbi:MAG: hypothetical protein WAM08_19680 [Candidatus Acidiferrales bacterium]
MTRYEPPQGISPAVAAYLVDNGRPERAFASALVSLAAKGYIHIEQRKDWSVLKSLRESCSDLSPEESVLLASLLPSAPNTYAFNGAENGRLCHAYREFTTTVDGMTDPDLISPHHFFWFFGVLFSVYIPLGMIFAFPDIVQKASPLSWLFCGAWAVLGGSCLVAALRIWPATLRKFASFLPFNRRPLRLPNWNDAAPVYLTVTSLLGFAFLAVSTSTQFALLVTALVVIHFVGRHLLEAPTAAGREVLAELGDFREFLSRADADRLNRENKPGLTPQNLEVYSAYALALEVEHTWGEEFTEGLIELLQYEQAYDRWLLGSPDASRGQIELKIDPRK